MVRFQQVWPAPIENRDSTNIALDTFITLHEIEEIQSWDLRGQKDADEKLMGAGFLGGSTKFMIIAWIATGCLAAIGVAYKIGSLLHPSSINNSSEPIRTSTTRVIINDSCWLVAFISASLIGYLRAFFLHKKKFRDAYLTFVLGLPIIVLSQLYATLYGIIEGVSILSLPKPAESQVCEPKCFLPPKVYLGIVILGTINCTTWGLCYVSIIKISFELSKGKTKSAQLYFSIALATFTVAFSIVFAMSLIYFKYGLISSVIGPILLLVIVTLSSATFVYVNYTLKLTKIMALKLMEKDKKRYDDKWHEYIGRDPTCGPRQVRQLDELVRGILGHNARLAIQGRNAGSTKPHQNSTNLVRLYTEANCLCMHFYSLIDKIASGVEGVQSKHPSAVKKYQRAVEKVYRSYSGDASKLIDLVRSSITCGTLDSIIEIIKRIRDDPNIRILQIKNRFRPHYVSSESAGYRNVALSLRIDDATTKKFKVEKHVCELQVGLQVMDDVKQHVGSTDGEDINDMPRLLLLLVEKFKHERGVDATSGITGHDKYVIWRDMLAE